MRSPWKFPFDVVSESLLEVIPVPRKRCSLLLRLGSVVSLARLSSPLRTCRLGVRVPCSFHFHAALIVAITPKDPVPSAMGDHPGVLCTSPRCDP